MRYFVLEGNEQKGPFTAEELRARTLSADTYVWKQGDQEWRQLHQHPELNDGLKMMPPPPPPDALREKEHHEPPRLPASETSSTSRFRPSRGLLLTYLIWFCIHFIALVGSYAGFDIINDEGPESRNFWPFVEFGHTGLNTTSTFDPECCYEVYYFYGIFPEYDISEFVLYILIPVFAFFIFRLAKPDREPPNEPLSEHRHSAHHAAA